MTTNSNNPFDSFAASTNSAADTFLKASQIYFESLERLASLNLATAREAMEDASALAQGLGGLQSLTDLQTMQPGLTPAIEKSVAYVRSVQEIMSDAQSEMTQLMTAQFSSLDIESKAPAAWNAALALFSNGARQMVSATEGRAANAKVAKKAA